MKRLWRLIAWVAGIGVVLVLLTPLLSSHLTNKPDGDKHEASIGRGKGKHGEDGPIPVLVTKSRQAEVPVFVEGVGTGQALNSVLIRSQVDGTLMKLNFVEGQAVKAGDVIAKIDPRLYQAALDQNIAKKALDEANLANARRDLDRYAKLAQTKAATQQQYDTQKALVTQGEAQVAIDQALIDSTRTTLSYTNIVSPIAGRTGIRKVDVGNLIHAADTTGIVTVSQIQPIAVIFNVPQQELPRINKANLLNQIDVQATDSGGANVVDHGSLAVVDNMIDQTTGTVKLKATFPNDQLQLWPGIFVNVRLRVETLHNAIVIPIAALQRGPTGPFVFAAIHDKTTSEKSAGNKSTGDKAVMRPVTIDQQDDTQAVIGKGLKADEIIVTSGFQKLTDGAEIKPSEDKAAASTAGGAPALHEQSLTPPAPETPQRGGRDKPGRQSRAE